MKCICRLKNDINEINHDYAEYLHDAFGVWSFDIFDISDDYIVVAYVEELFDIFLQEYLYKYIGEVDLMWEVRDFIQELELEILYEWKLLDKYEAIFYDFEKNFKLPELNASDKRDLLIQEVLDAGGSSPYYIRLCKTLVNCYLNKTDELTKYQMINKIIVDYDFEVKMPAEIKEYAEQRYRINNYIPDFSNVKVGDSWTGGRRMTEFIRALKLTPKKAKSNSRIAQEKSIARSCEWIDDAENKILTLTKIYPERLPKIQERNTRKYEKYFDTILRYLLQSRDEFTTTSKKLLMDIGAISKNNENIMPYEYVKENYFKEANIGTKSLENNLKIFHENVQECFGKIWRKNLQYLEDKKIICRDTNLFIVKGNERILIDEIDSWGLTISEAYEMLEQAQKEAIKKIEVYDEISKKKIHLENMSQVRHRHKYDEYKENYEKYIRENYGWSYTYEEISLWMPEDLKSEKVTYKQYEEAKTELNKLLIDAIRTSVSTKDSNLKEKYNAEEEKALSDINANEELRGYYEIDVIDEDSVIGKRQYIYPESYLYCVEEFIRREIEL